jgi:hypothetical protein
MQDNIAFSHSIVCSKKIKSMNMKSSGSAAGKIREK